MKLLTIILLFISYQLFAEYDSTYVLAVRQNFCIPENVVNGDYIGQWRKTYTWLSGNAISYAIQTNYYDAFAINTTTGILSINDATHINGKRVAQDSIINLIIRTTDAVIGYEDDTARIRVKENSYCKFIDYSYSGTESGTRTQPYNDIDDVTITAGYGYFIKRGNNAIETTSLAAKRGTATNPIVFGAYDAGELPIFNGNAGNVFMWYFGTGATPADSCSYIEFYDMIIRNTAYSAFKDAQSSHNCYLWFNNLKIWNCGQSADVGTYEAVVGFQTTYEDTLQYRPFYFRNIEWDTVSGASASNACMKIGAGPNEVVNVSCKNISTGDALRFTQGKNNVLKHAFIEDCGTGSGAAAVQIRGDSMLVEDVHVHGMGGARGITIASSPDPHVPENCLIKNVFIEDVTFAAYIDGDNGVMHDNIIEDCEFHDCSTGFIVYDNHDMVIRYSLFDNVPIDLGGGANAGIYFYYNIGYGDDLLLSAGTTYTLLNNTWDDDINSTTAGTEVVRNTYFKSLSGTISTQSDNADIDTITTATTFINYAAHDYSLKSTAWGINRAYEVGATRDYIGNTKSGSLWDIGAYEFQLPWGDQHYINEHLINEYINGKRINRNIK